MNHESETYCPFCDSGFDEPHSSHRRGHRHSHPHADSLFALSPNRRQFLKTVGGGAAALVAGQAFAPSFTPLLAAEDLPARQPNRVAEDLIRELYATLSAEQKREVVHPWDHGNKGAPPARLGTYNSPIDGKRIRDHYTPAQQELLEQILRSILSSDEAFDRIGSDRKWDSSKSFDGCGATIFGEPTGDADKPFAWVFSGHHLTLRCDGNSQPGAAFGGPIYYGHSKPGYSRDNVFYYQTEQVQAVYDSLDKEQRQEAIADRNPGDGRKGVRFSDDPDARHPGIAFDDLGAEQQAQVEVVLQTLLAPFRQEDADEVMSIIRAHGGKRNIHLAFYKDEGHTEDQARWHFWRLEGPGFIWNYRPLPHVHCFVNVANQGEAQA